MPFFEKKSFLTVIYILRLFPKSYRFLFSPFFQNLTTIYIHLVSLSFFLPNLSLRFVFISSSKDETAGIVRPPAPGAGGERERRELGESPGGDGAAAVRGAERRAREERRGPRGGGTRQGGKKWAKERACHPARFFVSLLRTVLSVSKAIQYKLESSLLVNISDFVVDEGGER